MIACWTRREFLGRSAAVAAFATLARSGRAAGGMYVSLNGALTRGVSGIEKARLAAQVGFGGVDWDLAPFKTLGLEPAKAVFADLKIKPTIVNLPLTGPFAGDDAAFAAKLPQLSDDSAFVAAIGCTKMMLVLQPTGPTPKEEYRKLVRDRLSAIGEVLRKSNLRLGLEFLGPLQFRQRAGAQEFIWKMSETVDLAKDSGSNLGVVLDAWHWHHSGSTVADILAAGKARVIQVHVSDAKAQPPEEVRDNMRLMPGEGIIDLVGFFQALQKIGYDESISPEPLGRIPMDMSAEDGAKLGLSTTLAVMSKAGVR